LENEHNILKSILPPTDDRLFKLLMTSPELRPGLADIISSIIRQPVADVEIRNNELPTDDVDDKQERLDINCVTDDGRQVNLEMQASRIEELPGGAHDNLKNKSVYYLCDLFSTQSVKGKDYNKPAKTYQVTFCAYTVFPGRESFVNEFTLRNEDGEPLADAITVVFVELSKLEGVLRKPVEEMTSLEMWAIFLQYADKPEKKEIIERVAEAKGEIKMALNTLIHVSQDERERAINRSRRMWQTDMESNLNTAKESGIIKGKTEMALAIAKNLLMLGLPAAQIVKATGLSESEVEKLRS
jgi:predicted transposase/invertase (TIGR01784 family)